MKLKISGMMCQNCVKHVKKALEAIPGVTADVDLSSGTATLTGADAVSADALKQAVTDAGYEVTAIE